jgi:hypothetical protein
VEIQPVCAQRKPPSGAPGGLQERSGYSTDAVSAVRADAHHEGIEAELGNLPSLVVTKGG